MSHALIFLGVIKLDDTLSYIVKSTAKIEEDTDNIGKFVDMNSDDFSRDHYVMISELITANKLLINHVKILMLMNSVKEGSNDEE